jgi:hypothetical protein
MQEIVKRRACVIVKSAVIRLNEFDRAAQPVISFLQVIEKADGPQEILNPRELVVWCVRFEAPDRVFPRIGKMGVTLPGGVVKCLECPAGFADRH